MDVHDNLIVRICKSNKPTIQKLRKVWGIRCMLPSNWNPIDVDFDLANHLLEMVSQIYKVIPNHRMTDFIIRRCSPYEQCYMHSLDLVGNSHINCIIRACVSALRLTKVDKFEGYRKDARWTNNT